MMSAVNDLPDAACKARDGVEEWMKAVKLAASNLGHIYRGLGLFIG